MTSMRAEPPHDRNNVPEPQHPNCMPNPNMAAPRVRRLDRARSATSGCHRGCLREISGIMASARHVDHQHLGAHAAPATFDHHPAHPPVKPKEP